MFRRVLILIALAGRLFAASAIHDKLDQAWALVQNGSLKQARALFVSLLPELRTGRQDRDLADALKGLSEIDLAEGQYPGAAEKATEAAQILGRLQQAVAEASAWTNVGLARYYTGNYSAAMDCYEKALALDRAAGNKKDQIILLNDIGTVFQLSGKYADAFRKYQEALKLLGTGEEKAHGRARQMTLTNLAILYQQLGHNELALELYARLQASPQELKLSEQAQVLWSLGVLNRRLGDPVKALEHYRNAQALYGRSGNREGEGQVLLNIGILQAFDLKDPPEALHTFTAVLELANKSSNRRLMVETRLYLAETERRLARLDAAQKDFQIALDGSAGLGIAEQKWKALYGLGRVAGQLGNRIAALQFYREAVTAIESVRAGIGTGNLRSGFLADKRDVYDALIETLLNSPQPSTEEVFRLMEQSRARNLQDLLRRNNRGLAANRQTISLGIPADSCLLEFWMGSGDLAVLWITQSQSGILHQVVTPQFTEQLQALRLAVSEGGEPWKALSREIGSYLFSGMPWLTQTGVHHLIMIPDGPLHGLPMELLMFPGQRDSSTLLLERYAVSYLPSASLLPDPAPASRAPWVWPWQRRLVAFADPSLAGDATSPAGNLLPADMEWLRLPKSADEVRSVGDIVGGRLEIHTGADARKEYLLDGRSRGVPLLLISTHAVADFDDPDRSRVLFAPPRGAHSFDYLFAKEAYGLDLAGVDLVTVSACDTEQGKSIRGEGVLGFSRAFLAAGARSTVTTLWKVGDNSTGEFMKQFYYGLSRGVSKASALQAAKLTFLHSNGSFAEPKYWAAFILNGEARGPIPWFVPWWSLPAAGAAVLILFGAAVRRISRAKRPCQKSQSTAYLTDL